MPRPTERDDFGGRSPPVGAVSAAVSMKSLSAPSVDKSYVSLDTFSNSMDKDGLPLVYGTDLIQTYWKKERGALNQRWSYFVGKAMPIFTSW